MIAKKAVQANKSKLTVILCVGERARDDAGAYFNEVKEQLRTSLEGFPKTESKRLVIAYEPIWANPFGEIGQNFGSKFSSIGYRWRKCWSLRCSFDRCGGLSTAYEQNPATDKNQNQSQADRTNNN